MWKVTEVKRQQNIVHLEIEKDSESYSFIFADIGKTIVSNRHKNKKGNCIFSTIKNAENVEILKGGVFSHKGLRLPLKHGLPREVAKLLSDYGWLL
jgi:hypothetical protein